MAVTRSAHVPEFAPRISDILDFPRHRAIVRATHWINTLSFLGLLISGVAILLAHPRFYWGEAGGLGAPSLFDLPLPFMKGGPSGWGRNLHFLSTWICLFNGSVYVVSGILTRHFHRNLLPAKADLAWASISRAVLDHLRFKPLGVETSFAYNLLQRLTYLAVIFVLFPLIIWTGLAMSPAIVAVFPKVVTVLGGQQSARTIHFFAADFLVLFVLVHICMICFAGFKDRVGAMITGQIAAGKDRT
jgi:thiosulfate reductase cytochrome b subunit